MLRFLIYSFFSLSAFLAHADKLCYSTVSRSVQSGTFNGGVALTTMPRNQRHGLALQASRLIYRLSDLETAATGAEFLAGIEAFEKAVPRGYRYEYYFANRASGLKYMILSPLNPTDPWIFAFAGTQTAIDWMSDLNLGRAQFANVEGMLYNLTNCEYQDREGLSTAARNWIVTGHSLGGGLAEAFAYTAQKRRLAQGLSPLPMDLVTFNAFGALDVVANSPAEAKAVTDTFLTANYFVTGDVVSRIGTHIGSTFELQMPKASLLQAATRHVIETVWSTAVRDGAFRFDLALPAMPPKAGTLNALKGYGSLLHFLSDNQSENLAVRLGHMNTLEDALNIILRRRGSGAFDTQALRLLSGIGLIFLRDEQAKPSTAMRAQLVARLENFLSRCAAAPKR